MTSAPDQLGEIAAARRLFYDPNDPPEDTTLDAGLRRVIRWARRTAAPADLTPAEAKLPLKFNGIPAPEFIKRAYGLGADLKGPGRFDLSDPVQQELRRIKDWITMAERDALEARKES